MVQAGWLTVLDLPFGDGWNVRLAPPGQINHMREGRGERYRLVGRREGGLAAENNREGRRYMGYLVWHSDRGGGGRDGTDVNIVLYCRE